jgi:hypothetical protein
VATSQVSHIQEDGFFQLQIKKTARNVFLIVWKYYQDNNFWNPCLIESHQMIYTKRVTCAQTNFMILIMNFAAILQQKFGPE